MKQFHPKMDKLDDSDEYLHQTLSSHFKIILGYIETLSSFSFSNLDFDYLEDSARSLIMKPSTSIFLITIIILLFFTQTFDFWLNVLHNKFPFKLVTRHYLRTGFTGGHLKNVIYELKANQVGIYAIQGRRPHMEDNFSFKFDTLNGECLLNGRKLEHLKKSNLNLTDHNFEMIAVFDGHGGSTASNYAQENLLNALKKSFDELIIDSNLSQCKQLNVETISKILTEQILKLDSILCSRLKNSGDIAGSTAIIALRYVNTNELIIANIGDSRGVLCDSKGNTIALSFDHKPNTPVEYKRIYDAGGFVKFNGVFRVCGILACSRALGDFPLKEKNYVVADPDILTFDLNDIKPKFAILASDGLFDFFSNEAAIKFVKDKMEELLSMRFAISKNELSLELAKQLTLEAFKKGSTDNITVVVWIFDYEPFKQVAKQTISSVKEVKVQRTKKADELEEIQNKRRCRIERMIENKFVKEVIYHTENLICDIGSIEFNEFKISDNLIDTMKNDVKEDESTRKESSDIKLEDKNSQMPQEFEKKRCSKKVKKFGILNLDLNLRKSEKESTSKKEKPCKNTKCADLIESTDHQPANKKCEEKDALDKNANSIYEVRLKDEYNLVRSPKKTKNQPNANQTENQNEIKLKSTQSDEEFFDC